MLEGTATGDGALTGILDVCGGGSFAGPGSLGCTGTPNSALAVLTADTSMPWDGVSFPRTGVLDLYADLTADGGLSGSAVLTSATIGLQTVPEPGAIAMTGAGLALLTLSRKRAVRTGGQS